MFVWLGCGLSHPSAPQWGQIKVIMGKRERPDSPVLRAMGLEVYRDEQMGKESRTGNGNRLWCD